MRFRLRGNLPNDLVTKPSCSPPSEARALAAPSRATCAPPKHLPCSAMTLGMELAQASGDSGLHAGGAPSALGRQLLSRRLRGSARRMPTKAWPPTITSVIVTLPGAIPGMIQASAAGRSRHRCSAYAASRTSAVQRSREAMALAERDSHPVNHGAGADGLQRRPPHATRAARGTTLGGKGDRAVHRVRHAAAAWPGTCLLRLGARRCGAAGRRHPPDARGDCGDRRNRRRHGNGLLPLRAGTRLRRARRGKRRACRFWSGRSTRLPNLARTISCRSYCAPRESCCRGWIQPTMLPKAGSSNRWPQPASRVRDCPN